VIGTGGKLKTPDDVIHCGNSGIILRFFTALAGCCDGYTVLTGDESLRHIRPMQPLLDAMGQLGATAISTKSDGHAPIIVKGRLRGGRGELDGADSQFVSALLIAAALADAPTELAVHDPGEKPWVGVTLDWMKRMGIEFENDDFASYLIRGRSKLAAFEYTVPLDWSAALYPLTAALVTSDSVVRVPGMDLNDTQGDKGVLDVLIKMGADISTDERGNIVAKSSRLIGREIDCNDFIDQLPLLAVIGAFAEGETKLTNAAVCREKECNRIAACVETLSAMGADIAETDDGLVVRKSRLRGRELSSYHDHRMVMAMSIAALNAKGQTRITDCSCVKKTFPQFQQAMQNIGAEVRKHA
jgi:3-phosphoshikimate 1-carboxyvinyltransferase